MILSVFFFFVCILWDFEHPAYLAFFGKHLLSAPFFGKVSGVNSVLFLAWFLVPELLLRHLFFF